MDTKKAGPISVSSEREQCQFKSIEKMETVPAKSVDISGNPDVIPSRRVEGENVAMLIFMLIQSVSFLSYKFDGKRDVKKMTAIGRVLKGPRPL